MGAQGRPVSTSRHADPFCAQASFLAGCIGVVLCGTPFILLAYGPRIRAAVRDFAWSSPHLRLTCDVLRLQSKFAKELERMQAGK